MSVYDNVAFALRVTNVSSKDIKRRVLTYWAVGLTSKARHMPDQLSGGEQQRVCIGSRAGQQPFPHHCGRSLLVISTRNIYV
jgi:cell division transport system ATP-binding protein